MAEAMSKKKHGNRFTLGADKAYDSRDLVTTLQAMNVTPHVAQNNKNRRSAIDGRTTSCRGYAIYRADVWVAQIGGRDEEGKTARSGEGELAVPVRGGGIQPVENSKTSSGKSVVASAVEPDARRSGADRGPKDQENVAKT